MNEIDLRRFDLNLLVVFDVLMIERSVTRAAERLGRTQSAVSHSLSRLREQFGDPLLVKGGLRMQPTAFALDLIEQAPQKTRFVWTTDILPDELAGYIDAQMTEATKAMKPALER